MNKFIGLKRQQKQVSNNLYVDEFKLVIKLPLIEKEKDHLDIEAENFDITSYNLFIPYE